MDVGEARQHGDLRSVVVVPMRIGTCANFPCSIRVDGKSVRNVPSTTGENLQHLSVMTFSRTVWAGAPDPIFK